MKYCIYNKNIHGEVDIHGIDYVSNRQLINEYCAFKLIELGYEIDDVYIGINDTKITQHENLVMCYNFYEMWCAVAKLLQSIKRPDMFWWVDGYKLHEGNLAVDINGVTYNYDAMLCTVDYFDMNSADDSFIIKY